MNVNVIDNQLLESLNNYFNTLSKTGYIKNSNSEALLVLSFLQEITSDYTDLVTFLNSLSENYCIIPFLDLSTCKVDLNSSDQLVRFTANLDDVSAYVNTSYLNNQLINFPYMAITGKSIQINDINAPDLLNNESVSVLGQTSSKFVKEIKLNNTVAVQTKDANSSTNYPITFDVDHEKTDMSVDIKLLDLPHYTLSFISGESFSLDTHDNKPLLHIDGVLNEPNNDFTVVHRAVSSISSNSSNRWKVTEYIALTTDSGIYPSSATGKFTLKADNNGITIGTGYFLKDTYDLTAIVTSDFGNTTGSNLFLSPIFVYYDPGNAGAMSSILGDGHPLPDRKNYPYIGNNCAFNRSISNLDSSSQTLIGRYEIGATASLLELQYFNYSDTYGYGNSKDSGNTPITAEIETYNCIVLKSDLGIIPTTREDGSAEDIVADGIAIGSCYNDGAEYIGVGIVEEPIKLGSLIEVSTKKDHLLWCGKLFSQSSINFSFLSPEGTILEISTAVLESGSTSTPIDRVTITTQCHGNFNSLLIQFSSYVLQERNYVLRLGGHIQYNTTTVNITGNISGMSVNIEGEGTVSLPATITVNRP